MLKKNRFMQENKALIERLFYNRGIDVEIQGFNNPRQGKWCFYPRLSIIAPRKPSAAVNDYALSHYDTRGGIHRIVGRKMARRAYLNSFGLLAAGSMDITGISQEEKHWMFLIRKRALYLLDFSDATVTSVQKNSQPRQSFKNLLEFRKNHDYSFLPNLIEYGEDWYRETFIKGKLLSLYENSSDYNTLLSQSLDCIKALAKDTLVFKDPREYSDELCRRIANNLEELSVDPDCRNVYKQIAGQYSEKAQQLNKMVPVVRAHCDFHPANIMVDKQGEVYILDWEANDQRSIWYDPAVMLLGLRRPDGLREILSKFDGEKVSEALLFNDGEKNYNMESLVSFLALENLLGKTIIAADFKERAGAFLDRTIQFHRERFDENR